MKNFFLLITTFLMVVNLFAQTPKKMSYQAVIRNNESQLVANQTIGMNISILKDTPEGTEVYSEIQTPQTNKNGLISVEIGGGEGFAAIDWSHGVYFLKTAIDLQGGTNYTLTSTQQLLSVPFAFYAETAGSAASNDNLEDVLMRGNVANASIKGVTNPTEAQDATTKSYVDALIAALDARVTALEGGSQIVDADGNVYTSVVIGTQEWLVQNLKTTKYSDGTEIPLVTDNTEWTTLSTAAYCWLNNDIANKETFGALYNWFTVNSGNICPNGWHVPSDAEWTVLTDYLATQGYDVNHSAIPLKATSGWNENGNGTDVFGFTGLPAGDRSSFNGEFFDVGNSGFWWTTTENDADFAFLRELAYNIEYMRFGTIFKKFGFSVRCVKD